MSRPKRHHIVPQFFLERFARDGKVKVVHRDERTKSWEAGVENVLCEKYFYDAPLEEAPNVDAWWLETALSQAEGQAKCAFDRLDAGHFPPVGEDRDVLRTFMALSLVRGFRMRVEIPRIWENTMHGPLPSPHQMQEEAQLVLGEQVSLAEAEDLVESLRRDRERGAVLPPNAAARLTPALCDLFSNGLKSRTWHMLEFDEPLLLTGDAPVALNHDKLSRTQPLGMMCDEILMPIDPRRALFLLSYAKEDGTTRRGSRELARKLNFTVASQCIKWIVHHPEHDPLANVPDFGRAEETLVPR